MAEDLSQLPRSPHADKFRLALAVLVGISVGAILIAVAVLLSHHSSSTGAENQAGGEQWSSWQPTRANTQSDIADYVAPFYRQNGTQQLAVVTPLNIASISASGTPSGNGMVVAFNAAGGGSGANSKQQLGILPGKSVAYNICGLGAHNCQLGGTPSTLRMLLMRREALELSLFTLKYMPSADNVITVLPPTQPPKKSGAKPVTTAVVFDRKELSSLLSTPLDDVLSPEAPLVSQLKLWKNSEEASGVSQLTARALFSSKVEQQQDGTKLLVLNSLPPS